MKNLKFRSVLCASIAFVATLIAWPPTILYMYEPEVPAKLKK